MNGAMIGNDELLESKQDKANPDIKDRHFNPAEIRVFSC
jgi:hypothetical protein